MGKYKYYTRNARYKVSRSVYLGATPAERERSPKTKNLPPKTSQRKSQKTKQTPPMVRERKIEKNRQKQIERNRERQTEKNRLEQIIKRDRKKRIEREKNKKEQIKRNREKYEQSKKQREKLKRIENIPSEFEVPYEFKTPYEFKGIHLTYEIAERILVQYTGSPYRTISDWAENLKSYHQKFGGLQPKRNLLNIAFIALIRLRKKGYASKDSTDKWKILSLK